MLGDVSAEALPGSLVWSAIGAAWTWVLAILVGAAILPRTDDRDASVGSVLAWAVIGAAVLGHVVLVLSACNLLTPSGTLVAFGVVTVLAGGLAFRRVLRTTADALSPLAAPSGGLRRGRPPLHVLVIGATVLLAVGLACIPTTHYDDLVYHIGLPRQALLLGHWPLLPHFHHSLMPAGWDAVHVLPLALGGGAGPQLANAVGLGLLAAATMRLASRGGPADAAGASVALLAGSGVILSSAALAGNDLFVALALVVALDAALERPRPAILLAGLAAGAAAAAKHVGLLGAVAVAAAVLAAPATAMRQRLVRAAAIGALALAVASPWYVRAAIATGNPFHPAYFDWIGGEFWDAESARLLTEDSAQGALPVRGPSALVLGIVDLAHRSSSLGLPSGLGLVYIAFAFAGLVLVRRVREGPAILAFLATSYVLWCSTSLMLRFFIAPLAALTPFAAAAIASAGESCARREPRYRAAFISGMLCWALGAAMVVAWRHPGVVGLARWAAVWPRSEVLVTHVDLARAQREMAARLPASARLLVVGEARLALLPRPAELSSALDVPLVGELLEGCRTPPDVDAKLGSRATHVLVNYRELARFDGKYGMSRRLGATKAALLREWLGTLDPVGRWGHVVLYESRGTDTGS